MSGWNSGSLKNLIVWYFDNDWILQLFLEPFINEHVRDGYK
jgi:hypothetical protein